MKKMNQIIYGVFGIGAILFGVLALLFQGALLSEAHRLFPTTHIFREEGAAAVFIGLMSLWCIFNYERRTSVHYCLIAFAFLIAAILAGGITYLFYRRTAANASQRKAVQMPAMRWIAKRAEIRIVWRHDQRLSPVPQQAMEFFHAANHV